MLTGKIFKVKTPRGEFYFVESDTMAKNEEKIKSTAFKLTDLIEAKIMRLRKVQEIIKSLDSDVGLYMSVMEGESDKIKKFTEKIRDVQQYLADEHM